MCLISWSHLPCLGTELRCVSSTRSQRAHAPPHELVGAERIAKECYSPVRGAGISRLIRQVPPFNAPE